MKSILICLLALLVLSSQHLSAQETGKDRLQPIAGNNFDISAIYENEPLKTKLPKLRLRIKGLEAELKTIADDPAQADHKATLNSRILYLRSNIREFEDKQIEVADRATQKAAIQQQNSRIGAIGNLAQKANAQSQMASDTANGAMRKAAEAEAKNSQLGKRVTKTESDLNNLKADSKQIGEDLKQSKREQKKAQEDAKESRSAANFWQQVAGLLLVLGVIWTVRRFWSGFIDLLSRPKTADDEERTPPLRRESRESKATQDNGKIINQSLINELDGVSITEVYPLSDEPGTVLTITIKGLGRIFGDIAKIRMAGKDVDLNSLAKDGEKLSFLVPEGPPAGYETSIIVILKDNRRFSSASSFFYKAKTEIKLPIRL